MTNLTADVVDELTKTCMLTEEEVKDPTTVAIPGQGIIHVFGFSPERIEEHHEEIRDLLYQLGPRFRVEREGHPENGGGWSFLNMCMDENDEQWTGDQMTMEALFAMGIASGWAKTLPKKYWASLPGGMPYLMVNVERSQFEDRMTVAEMFEAANASSYDKDTVRVATGRCIICGEQGEITMPKEAYKKWQAGEHIQRAWPEGSADDREQLATGTHGACFDKTFPEED